jgi:ornithine cyclodeaminase/alanine dehydrogenase
MKQKIRYLSSEDLHQLLDIPQVMDAMKDAFLQLSNKELVVPPRMHLDIERHQGIVLVKPVYSPKLKLIGLKVISLFKNNWKLDRPLSHAMMLVFDAETGVPLAMMDGDYLTAIRTGASSGLATQLLARQDAEVLTIFGAGPQAKTQLQAIVQVRKIGQVYIYDPNPEKCELFIREMEKKLSIPIVKMKSDRKLSHTDIICTVTTASTPVFEDAFVSEGVHINAIGSFKPDVREIPSETVKRAKLIVDQIETCLMEAGDITIPLQEKLISEEHIYAELGEIIGEKKPGRTSQEEITLFKSVGNAIQDLVTANLALGIAKRKDLGQELIL